MSAIFLNPFAKIRVIRGWGFTLCVEKITHMLITILTLGSRGDVQPYIALGVEIKKLGQRVRIVTFENFG